ncbi:MAG: SusC/RagA family TonB-linked outer membrane protein, partial [Flavisolibacter sp.]
MRRLLLLVLFMSLMTSQLLAQDRTISGKVTDEKGVPVANASVVVKGTRNGTITATDGSFSLSVPSNARALIISFIGLGEKEVGLTSSNSYDVSLSSTTGDLSEVVITGYKTTSKRDFVGSAGTVSGEKIRSVPMASFDQALQGRVPGILVQGQSGQPGAAAAVLIRGRGSILGSNTPLYILDGIQITAADFSTLNPADFESITILKDASATSAYGSRGANGVIVATSRKGKAGDARFNYDVQYGYSTLPENKLRVMNTNEKLDYEIANGNPYGWSATELDSLRKINTDWEDVFFRTGRTAQHVVSVSGGSGKTVYFLSGSFFDQRGSVENTSLKRYTGRANIESGSGNFGYGINATFGYSDFHNTGENNTSIGAPLNAIRWLNPYENVYTNGTYTSITSGQPHALQELLENNNLRQQYKTVANVFLNYAAPFLKGLNFRTNWGADFRINETSAFADPSTASGRAQTGNRGALARGNDRSQRFTGTTSLSYTTDFNADHALTVAVFNEIIQGKTRNFGFTGFGLGGAFENESGITPGNTTNGYIPTVNGNGGENAILSYFADVRYAFKNRYFLNIAGRRDGSSRFGSDRQWANFGSVGASWIISDEEFMASLKNRVFNELKFKISYGSAGNQEGIGNFESRELFSRAVYNGVSGLVQTQLENSELQWERRTTFNTGIEFTVLKNRLRGGFEFYNAITTDLFLNKQLSRTTGYTSLNTNIGELQNRGFEVSLDGDIINTRDFRWSANVSLTRNNNTVKKLEGDQKEIIGGLTINRVGESMNSIFLIRNAGVNPADGEPLYYDKDGKVTGIYDPANRVIVGSFEVPFFGGFGTALNYKGLELSTFFSFVKGSEIYNNDRMNVENPAYFYDNMWSDLQYEWRAPGQQTHIIAATADFDGWTGTDHFVEKGDFLRFRNAMLSYSLPSSIINKAKIK